MWYGVPEGKRAGIIPRSHVTFQVDWAVEGVVPWTARTPPSGPMLRRCSLAVILLVLTGCSHLHPWATDRDIEGSYDQVFQATLETFETWKFPIEEADRNDGRIVTGRRPVRVMEAGHRVEKAQARIRLNGHGEVEVQLFLTFMGQSGTVRRSKPDGEGERSRSTTSSAVGRSLAYDDYLDAIEERVRDLQEGL